MTMNETDFQKSTKKQKLAMPVESSWGPIKCSRVLFIPIPEKKDGYGTAACFVFSKNKWVRLQNYDCFRFLQLSTGATLLKGDFEHNGIVFFTGENATIEFGNEIKIVHT